MLKKLNCTPIYDKRTDKDSIIPCVHKSGKKLICFVQHNIKKDSYRIRIPKISTNLELYESQGDFQKELLENIIFDGKDNDTWSSRQTRIKTGNILLS